MSTISGLPAHILLVHAVVVLLPLSALLLVLTAVWPRTRARFAGPNAVLAVVVAALVPVTTSAGEWLEARVESTEAVRTHTELGDTALFVALPVAALALVVWWRAREARAAVPTGGGATTTATRTYLAPASTRLTTVVAVLAVLAAGAALVQTYRIGDSGARATWESEFSPTPLPGAREG